MERLKDGSQITGVVIRFRDGAPSRDDDLDVRHQAEAGEEDQSVEGWDQGA